MAGYIAEFSNGMKNEVKQSKREYGAAYLTIVKCEGKEHIFKGWSRDKRLAERSSLSEPRFYLKDRKQYGTGKLIPAGEIIFREVVKAQKVS